MFGIEQEVDKTGRRLDAARQALALSKDGWTQNYWNKVVKNLEHKWRHLIFRIDGKM
jgi:hypothetical protein